GGQRADLLQGRRVRRDWPNPVSTADRTARRTNPTGTAGAAYYRSRVFCTRVEQKSDVCRVRLSELPLPSPCTAAHDYSGRETVRWTAGGRHLLAIDDHRSGTGTAVADAYFVLSNPRSCRWYRRGGLRTATHIADATAWSTA